MTISGEMTKSRQLSIKFMGALMGLIFGAPILGFGLLPLLSPNTHLDKGTQIAALVLGPLVFALGFGLTSWFNTDTVAEFACDGSSLRLRKLGSGHVETRAVSDVAEVSSRVWRSGVLWYRVVFRDGTEAALSCEDLPNAKVFAEWLRSGSQTA